MQEYLTLLQTGVGHYGLWFVVAFLFIENIPLVGFVAPGLTILVLSGFFHELIAPSPLVLFLVAWGVITLADTLWYLIGRYGTKHSRWLQTLAKKSPDVQEVLTNQTYYALVCYQCVAYFRMFLPFGLGMYGYPLGQWVVLCTIASALYTAIFLGIGLFGAYAAEQLGALELIVNNLNRLLAVAAVIYGVFLYRKYQQTKEKGLG